MDMFRLLVIIALFAMVLSLGSALFHMARGKGSDPERSRKMARALTIRIGLGVLLFILLMLGWYNGLITPHGLGK